MNAVQDSFEKMIILNAALLHLLYSLYPCVHQSLVESKCGSEHVL